MLQHAEPEGPGLVGEILRKRGLAVDVIKVFKGERVPAALSGHVALLVMGGPMGVYEVERYPFLRDEIELIRDALAERKPVLGVCLGSQLLAHALGADVGPGRREIGWYPVYLTPGAAHDALWAGIDATFRPFHWHGDSFTLPQGAEALASSSLTSCQAFRYGTNAYGFLFHIEMDEAMVRGMVDGFGDELEAAGSSARDIETDARTAVPAMRRVGQTVFGRWADSLRDGR